MSTISSRLTCKNLPMVIPVFLVLEQLLKQDLNWTVIREIIFSLVQYFSAQMKRNSMSKLKAAKNYSQFELHLLSVFYSKDCQARFLKVTTLQRVQLLKDYTGFHRFNSLKVHRSSRWLQEHNTFLRISKEA